MRAMCLQAARPMEVAKARAALAHLATKAVGWFTIETTQHSRLPSSFLKRMPGCPSGASTREALEAELEELRRKHEELAR